MSSYNIRIEGLKELEADMARAGKSMMPILRKAMTASTAAIKRDAKHEVPVFEANLKRAIFDKVTSSMAKSVKGVVGVGSGAPYGLVVEVGRKPGKQPPIVPIKKWARIKLGNEGAAFAIARKIGRSGTKGQPFMLPALKGNLRTIENNFNKAADTIVRILAGKQ